ncbi:Peptidyl-prolyl cis-trans isomerase [hydrothermal vent metagenome]|uniref:peptidylprolyl isomerase n=1 Tax=hydrothermal vent metagenome TaxID=652676 RepID=A0A1W1C728_9ZZZZ
MLKKILLGLAFISLLVTEQGFAKSVKAPIVVLKTNQGDITIKLFPKIAPKAVENFITHSKNGYYNGTTFHRVIKGFMIQGGDPEGTGMGGESIWHKDFDNEYAPNVTFDRPFLLAMANRGPNTNGSQFFITTAKTPHLNGGYTIFGEVIKGQKVVRTIENVSTGDRDVPMFKQVIKKIIVK